MIPSKEQLAMRLLGTVLALAGLGVGLHELDKLADSKHVQKAVDTAVELVKQPEKALQSQSQAQSQPITVDRLIQNPIQYELPKPLVIADLCKHYLDIEKCKEFAKGEENEKKQD